MPYEYFWKTDEPVEVCEYCQCEIIPNETIYVSRDLGMFDKPECVNGFEKEQGIKVEDVKKFTFISSNPNGEHSIYSKLKLLEHNPKS